MGLCFSDRSRHFEPNPAKKGQGVHAMKTFQALERAWRAPPLPRAAA